MLTVVKQTNIDILYQMVIDRLDAQIKRVDGADTKIGVIFVITNTITAALASFMTLIPKPIPLVVLIFAILAATAYVVTLSFLFTAYWKYRWSYNPDIKTLRDVCADPKYRHHTNIVKRWVVNECIRSFEWNSRPLIMKVRQSYRALIAVSAQGLLLAAAFVSYLLD